MCAMYFAGIFLIQLVKSNVGSVWI